MCQNIRSKEIGRPTWHLENKQIIYFAGAGNFCKIVIQLESREKITGLFHLLNGCIGILKILGEVDELCNSNSVT